MSARIRLVKTCESCPEQYDAFIGDEQVGYLRLRHGHFRVDCPDCGGETVYSTILGDSGMFDTDSERHCYLTSACQAILRHISEMSPDELYEIDP